MTGGCNQKVSDQQPYDSSNEREERLWLRLLGGFNAQLGDATLPITSKKGQALLAMLSVHPIGGETREYLRGTLWSESTEKRAQFSLRNTIWALNSAFKKAGFEGFETTRDQLTLSPSSATSDVDEIRETLDTTAPDARICANSRIFESMLYGFEGLDEAFDEWLQVTREQLQKEAVRRLEEVLKSPDQSPAQLLPVAKLLVDYDAMNETACQALIRAYHSTGAVANALAVYQSLWDLLDTAYGEEPSPATQKLIVAIKSEAAEPSGDGNGSPWAGNGNMGGDGPLPADYDDNTTRGSDRHDRLLQGLTGGGESLVSRSRTSLIPPDKPTLAVLAFNNLSADPEQKFFSDGITEDIITALSKFRWFFVISRNSSFAYKDTPIDVKQVGRDLGVGYVIQGSVRRAGDQIRVSVQLIEAATGINIWAESYDRHLEDVFELQDEITQTIAAAAEPELAGYEETRASQKPTDDLQAWDLFHRGVKEIWQMSRSGVGLGEQYMRGAIAADPYFGQPHSYLAFGIFLKFLFGSSYDRRHMFDQGMAHARTALFLDRRDYFAHFAMGRLHTMVGDHTSAMHELAKSIVINPNFAHGYFGLATANVYSGNGTQANRFINQAIKLSPNDPLMWVFLTYKGCAFTLLDDYDEAIETLERACRFPAAQYWAFAELAAAYVHVNRLQQANLALQKSRSLEPGLSLRMLQEPIRGMKYAQGERTIENLRKLGLK